MQTMNRITTALAALPVAVALLPGAASAAASETAHRAGSCTAEGEYAVCAASGTAYRPADIYVHVTSSPGQQVQVYWDMACSKGFGEGGSSGQFTATTTVRRLMHHPYSDPSSCSVVASAGVATGGYLRVWISYRR